MKMSMVEFGEGEQTAKARWAEIISKMDKDEDGKISRFEYTQWWMKETSSKQNPDGTFIAGYQDYLMSMLAKLGKVKQASSELYAHEIEDDLLTNLFAEEEEEDPSEESQNLPGSLLQTCTVHLHEILKWLRPSQAEPGKRRRETLLLMMAC